MSWCLGTRVCILTPLVPPQNMLYRSALELSSSGEREKTGEKSSYVLWSKTHGLLENRFCVCRNHFHSTSPTWRCCHLHMLTAAVYWTANVSTVSRPTFFWAGSHFHQRPTGLALSVWLVWLAVSMVGSDGCQYGWSSWLSVWLVQLAISMVVPAGCQYGRSGYRSHIHCITADCQ